MDGIKFQKLTPTGDVELKAYEDALNFVFKDNDIRNVAISGPYCSGKSSIIKTYEKENNEKNFIHITLTHFKDGDKGNDDETKLKAEFKNNDDNIFYEKKVNSEDDNDIESTIEAKIINQLIQQIPLKNIPDTSFKIKQETKIGPILGITIEIAFLIIILLYFVFHKEWLDWISSIQLEGLRSFLNITNGHVFQFLIVVIAGLMVIHGIYEIVKFLSKRTVFQKLRFKDAEIEVVSEKDESYFDKHLDELLYLIRKSDADVIVFEDIDRFDNHVEIFEQLREINTLVNLHNDYKDDEGRKIIRFFYLLSDDIFTSSERTKFFDYIIPVIPVIDGSNSYNKLKEYLQEIDMFNKFDDHFLRKVCLYLNDLRLVKNIVNEFVIYEKMLGIIQLDCNKLLALIIYKNTFPSDYTALQNGDGYVYALFNNNESNSDNERQGEPLKLAEKINGDVNSEIFNITVTNELGEKNDYKNVKSSEYYGLLKYLIANGYIDDTYEDYVTFFYDNVLTIRDKDFCISVIDGDSKGYDYHLNNVKEVVNTLSPGDFKNSTILNYDLLNYLLQYDKDQRYLPKIVNQLKESCNFEFVVSYFNLEKEREKFVTFLNNLWPEFYSAIYNKQEDKFNDFLKLYSKYTLLLSNKDLLESINGDGCLTQYISSQPDYLDFDLEMEYIGPFINALNNIDVKFSSIDVNASNNILLDRVYQLGLYEINPDNIKTFLMLKYTDVLRPSYASRYYTTIFSKPNEPLCQYLEKWPEETLKAILNMTDGATCDDEEYVVSILNNTDISIDIRASYLSLNRTIITSLAKINEASFYKKLVEQGVVEYSAENILQFFSAIGFTEDLEGFINSGSRELNYTIACNLNNVDTKQFFKKSIDTKHLNSQRFREISEQLGYELPQLNQFNPSLDKVLILAELGDISISSNNLTFIRNRYPEAMQAYICADPENSIDKLARSFNKEEIEEILSWKEIQDPSKISLLNSKPNERFSVLHENYPDEVIKEILNRHRDDDDLPILYCMFNDYSVDIQDVIFNIANSKRDRIIQSRQELAFSLLKRFLKMGNLNFDKKFDLIRSQTDYLSKDEIIEAVSCAGCHEVAHAVKPNTKKSVEISEENKKALQLFKELQIITNYSENTETGLLYILKK